MPAQHRVRRGDSLWSLASQYLGSGARWPEILELHNQEVARRGKKGTLFPIEDESLIYVGQMVFVPPRQKVPESNSNSDNSNKNKGKSPAKPLNSTIEYTIGRDTPPVMHTRTYGDYTVKSEMSGKISIEMASPDRYRHSLELYMANNQQELKQKLYHEYDPALSALTAKPEMVYDAATRKLRIDAPIAAQANAGPYTIQVQAHVPNHMSGSVKPPPLSGNLKVRNRDYKYSAEIKLQADVIWHPRPKGAPELVKEKAPVPQPNPEVGRRPTAHKTRWEETVAEKGTVVAVVTVILYAAYRAAELFATRGMRPTAIPPFIHEIDRRNGYRHDA